MNPLVSHIKTVHHISNVALEALEKELTHHALRKDEILCREGQVCHRLYFLQEGCVRGYYYMDGKEVTHWFGFESDIVTSFHSFITQSPAMEYLEAMEDSTFWSIGREALYQLYDQYPEIERFGRMTCERYYIRLEERYVEGQFKTAAERYRQLLEGTPHIIQRVPLGYIASYLGISQETLSRIRAKAAG